MALVVKERTWRLELFVEEGDDPLIRGHREKVWLRADGTIAQRHCNIVTLERRLSAIAKQQFGPMTGLDLARLIAAAADTLRQEDIAAAKAVADAKAEADASVVAAQV